MDSLALLATWRKDLAGLASIKERVGWTQYSLPFSTLSDKFVSVYVRLGADGRYMVSDNGDLHEDAYEVGGALLGSPLPFRQALQLLACGHHENIKAEGEAFYCRVAMLEQLSNAMFDMAQFIQLAVNLAVLNES